MIQFIVDVIARIVILSFFLGYTLNWFIPFEKNIGFVGIAVITYWIWGAGVKRALNGYAYGFGWKLPYPRIDYVGRWEELTALTVWATSVTLGMYAVSFLLGASGAGMYVGGIFWLGFLAFAATRFNIGRWGKNDD
ncbi:MAG: hypothetical protein OXH73_11220 [Caldilineaceae bacterium]|nr:hypothetical protein [Caldilineaceae bacterium]